MFAVKYTKNLLYQLPAIFKILVCTVVSIHFTGKVRAQPNEKCKTSKFFDHRTIEISNVEQKR